MAADPAPREAWQPAGRSPGAAQHLLGIYLNDHLAGATGGSELARRLASSARQPHARSALQQLAADIAQDRAALLNIMSALEIPVRSYKVYAAWIGEKAGRLKLNGRLLSRSPLSGLVEIEMLGLGIAGKAAAWRTLRLAADRDARLDARKLDELIVRAGAQADLLEEFRVRAVQPVIGGPAAS